MWSCKNKSSELNKRKNIRRLRTRIAASLSLRAIVDGHVDVRVNFPCCLCNTSQPLKQKYTKKKKSGQ